MIKLRYEFPVFESFKKIPKKLLPKQILVETHFSEDFPNQTFKPNEPKTWLLRIISFYKDILALGYQIALREMNVYSGCCAEYILILDP